MTEEFPFSFYKELVQIPYKEVTSILLAAKFISRTKGKERDLFFSLYAGKERYISSSSLALG